jgi:hypothetical protein
VEDAVVRIEALGLDLPDEPVDRYVIEFFEVEGFVLRHNRWEYFVNTPWAEWAKHTGRTDFKGGAQLIDCWMTGDGRALGWKTGPGFIGELSEGQFSSSRKFYTTDAAIAREKLISNLSVEVAHRQAHLANANLHLAIWKIGTCVCSSCYHENILTQTYQRCSVCQKTLIYSL